MTENITEWFCS